MVAFAPLGFSYMLPPVYLATPGGVAVSCYKSTPRSLAATTSFWKFFVFWDFMRRYPLYDFGHISARFSCSHAKFLISAPLAASRSIMWSQTSCMCPASSRLSSCSRSADSISSCGRSSTNGRLLNATMSFVYFRFVIFWMLSVYCKSPSLTP